MPERDLHCAGWRPDAVCAVTWSKFNTVISACGFMLALMAHNYEAAACAAYSCIGWLAAWVGES